MKRMVVFFVIIALGIFIVFSFISANKKKEDEGRKLQAQVQETADFVTAKGSVHATSYTEDYITFLGLNVPYTNKKLEVEYDRYFEVGYDVTKMDFKKDGNKITITLPAAEIMDDYVDEKTIKTKERHNVFNQIDIDEDLKNCFEKYYKEDLAQAIDEGLLETAESSAKEKLEQLLSPQGEYEIVFKNS